MVNPTFHGDSYLCLNTLLAPYFEPYVDSSYDIFVDPRKWVLVPIINFDSS